MKTTCKKTLFPRRMSSIISILVVIIFCSSVFAQTYEQSITLNPGWNAIYLEVQPENYDPQSVFGDMDVSSVWTWAQRRTTVDFVQDPSEGLWNTSGWLVWSPEEATEHITTNLFAIFAGKCYVVNYTGTSSVTFTVSGQPSVDKIKWIADSFNLVGFHLDPANPPTFSDYFNPAPAHAGQAAYRLQANGQWTQVGPSDRMAAGEAYWVYSQGQSGYNGPLMVELPGRYGLDFDSYQQKYHVHVKNVGSPGTITIEMIGSAAPVPLNYRDALDDDEQTTIWPVFDEQMALDAPTDRAMSVQFSVDRANLTQDTTGSVLEIKDGSGARWLVPVMAKKASRSAFSGLWVGNVRVQGVSESQLGSQTPRPVYRPFSFRIMIHIDAFGQARLLKEVIQMWEDGTYLVVNDPDLSPTPLYQVDQPGHYVLITDDELIPSFQGVGQSGGDPVGYRISTAAYDFEGTEVTMNGTFDFLRALTVNLVMEPDLPSNPFMHKFHPDHNNLDEHYLPLPEGFEEALRFTRQFQLDFAELDPEGVEMGDGTWMNKPGWGSTIMGGAFMETISGVHKNDITVEGSFRLNLVSTTDTLNPGGTQ